MHHLVFWGGLEKFFRFDFFIGGGDLGDCLGDLIVELFQVADPQVVIFDLLNQSLHPLLQFFQNLLFRQARLGGIGLDCGFESVVHFCSLSVVFCRCGVLTAPFTVHTMPWYSLIASSL